MSGAEPTPGPDIDAAELEEWLNAAGREARVRLPVWLRFATGIMPYIDHAHCGPLVLTLDDSAMGIALMERLEDLLADEPEPLEVWLDGHWGPLIASDPGDGDGGHPFAVRALHGPVADDDERRAYRLS